MKKKLAAIAAVMMLGITSLTGCAGDSNAKGVFENEKDISVVSREDGSGTRGAFIELFGVEEKDDDGNKVDKTTVDAYITNNTAVMMTTVAEDQYAMGYISLGSMNDTVKALKIDGVAPSVDAVKDDSYKIARPFNIATKGELSDVAKDFMDYIMSSDGQAVISENGYVSISEGSAYAGNKPKGRLVIAGSSSVSPVMEKLKEAYIAINPDASIEIQTSDSTTGMESTIQGICDIGMASRELKDTEIEEGLSGTVIAMDGIVVIVNNNNPLEDISSEAVRGIFVGEIGKWSEFVNE